jgi:glycosyltransferase involved in cell wall biosynthesis
MADPIFSGRSGAPLSVVIPAYNEEKTLRQVVEKVLRLSCVQQIVIVDDCSSDRTASVANELAAEYPEVTVAHHQTNGGKTEALKTGFGRTTGSIVIVQDADLEYDPDEIPGLIAPIVDGYADVVYGSRFLVRKAARVLYFYHYLANRSLTFFSNMLTNINLTDVETGYKAFRGSIIREMVITSSGFGFEIEVTAKVAKLKCAIYEAPISYYGRTYEEGKKIGFRDGLAALWYILKFNLFCTLEASYRKRPVLAHGRGCEGTFNASNQREKEEMMVRPE